MVEWKNIIIDYIEKLDDGLDLDQVTKLINNKINDYRLSTEFNKHKQSNHRKNVDIKEIVDLVRELFYGRQDVFAVRWQNDKNGTSGYSPKCKNEWDKKYCRKSTRIKGACKDCVYRENLCLSDDYIKKHFTASGDNAVTLGIYPLLEDETCKFVVIDFDGNLWKEDILKVKNIYKKYGIESYIEKSRSGNGGHLWVFFSEKIKAKIARKLANNILETTINETGNIKFKSFDRIFPNQDYMPKGGYGNLIALPLQRQSVEKENSVFVDENFVMYKSQIKLLKSVKRYNNEEILRVLDLFPNIILKDVNDTEIDEDTKTLPWQKNDVEKIPEDLPDKLSMVLYDKIYIRKDGLHKFVRNKLLSLAVFHNPDYFVARKMRMNLHNIPIWIECFEEDNNFLMLPIGLEETIDNICNSYNIKIEIDDKRNVGEQIDVNFEGELRYKQNVAVKELFNYTNGIIHANTAFGKTVTTIALIAKRKVNTLIIVNKVSLLEQWREKLSIFLNVDKNEIGAIGGGKKKITGIVDVAVTQSLYRNHGVNEIVKNYGQIICDECHHVSAVGFEQILKNSPAKYKHGLTATLKRKDGKERIVLMQLGPVRFKDLSKLSNNLIHEVIVNKTESIFIKLESDTTINDIYNHLYKDEQRNKQIIHDIKDSLKNGNYPLVLTERKEHIEILAKELEGYAKVYKLHGGLKKKEINTIITELNNLDENISRVIIATSKYIGEGFDYPILDNLFLTMPISWSGRVKQYAGRIHRDYHEKDVVRIYDYLDNNIEVALKMYKKRVKSYKSMGYEIKENNNI